MSKNPLDATGDFLWVNGEDSTSLHQSIRTGLKELFQCHAVMIALADQPFVEAHEYQTLIHEYLEARAQGFTLVRPWNGQRPGNPCFIDRSHFEEILAEPDHDGGCSYLFQRHKEKTKKVLSTAHFFQDLDTPEDYARWNS